MQGVVVVVVVVFEGIRQRRFLSLSRAVAPALDFVAGLLKLSWRSGLRLGFVSPRFGCGSVHGPPNPSRGIFSPA